MADRILKEPAEYAKQLKAVYFTPNAFRIVIDLARLKPALPEEYIEAVIDELRALRVEPFNQLRD